MKVTWLSELRFEITAERVAAFTKVSKAGVLFTAEKAVEQASPPNVLVECGVWKGGCGLAMLLAQRAVYGDVLCPVHFLDSFEGLPKSGQWDGPSAATRWGTNDNCEASAEELEATLRQYGFVEGEYKIWKGWFADTVPLLAEELRTKGISLLRLDGDWYDSTMVCLEQLIPLTRRKAIVILDDYYDWVGCSRAVHDYLSKGKSPFKLRSIPDDAGAYFYKE